jgi:aspartyl aminopeptidase
MNKFISFLEKCPTADFAVKNISETLNKSKFKRLEESEEWHIETEKDYYVSRGNSAIIAFRIPKKFDKLHFVGAHTDSPNLRLRHVPDSKNENYAQHAIEIYGGVLLHTWIDRDLAIAGKLIIKSDKGLRELLINVNKPIFKIPSLAIHLNRNVNEDGLKFNKHKHFNVISGLINTDNEEVNSILSYLAKEYNIKESLIKGFDLSLYDYNPPALTGLNEEFISSPRLDNLAMCYASIEALKDSKPKSAITFSVLFDHEEVGSESYTGAAGSFLSDTLSRIQSSLCITNFFEMKSNSYFISADMAHAIHPNYKELHDSLEFPLINKGPVIKYNINERYATNAETEAYLIDLLEDNHIAYQRFTNRQDLACGSTIGPAISTRVGIKTIDIGNPMLSMHSIRELCGVKDMHEMIKLFKAFYSK